jgi:hypothetical protein
MNEQNLIRVIFLILVLIQYSLHYRVVLKYQSQHL